MNATIRDAFKALEDIKDEVVKPSKPATLNESKKPEFVEKQKDIKKTCKSGECKGKGIESDKGNKVPCNGKDCKQRLGEFLTGSPVYFLAKDFMKEKGYTEEDTSKKEVRDEFYKYAEDNIKKYIKKYIDGNKAKKESLVKESPVYSLQPRYDARKDFYGKARVDTTDSGDKNRLYSYDTLVAEIKDGKHVVYDVYSATTLRHIKEWLKQNGFKAESKQQIIRDYGIKQESVKPTCKNGKCGKKVTEGKTKKRKVGTVKYQGSEYDVVTDDKHNGNYNYEIVTIQDKFGRVRGEGKTRYMNRTWQSYEYQQAFEKALKDAFSIDTKEISDGAYSIESAVENFNRKYSRKANEGVVGRAKGLKKNLRNRMLGVKEAVVNTRDDDAMRQAKDDLEDSGEEPTEKIVDVDAETVDELKDSYIGNAILQCPVCRTLLYKKPDLLKQDEEDPEIWNKDEECPHCGSEDGFELVGQVAEMDIEDGEVKPTTGVDDIEVEDDIDVDDEVEADDEDTAEEGDTEEEEEVTLESFDEKRFNSVTNKYLKSVYSNVDLFEATSGKIDNKNNKIFIEGVVKFKSGKQMKTKFVFESVSTKRENGERYIKLQGMNESLVKSGKPFTLVAKVKGKGMLSESLSYDYVVKTKDSKKRVKGKTRA